MKEVIDEDEWLHTGDIGLWLPCDRLKIIDRDVGREGFMKRNYITNECCCDGMCFGFKYFVI
ncbi:long chain acyl-CoA synthetase 6, peroxisomal-like [Iris pallida]|uniref:Long chain acyl-CoA synthetase 6, peroxisomal-like n=1 Tax=Iris pallida TaxID=29817 RepID=A0AAX6G3Z0_IRIPA|nr:long chain acyl-CoA synthetase 6, peroxisomal-like [Iris pallida]